VRAAGGGRNEREAARVSTGRYYADVPNRTVALVVDAVLLTVTVFVAATVVSVLIGPAVEFNSAASTVGDAVTVDRGIATVDAVVSLVVSAAYFAGSWVVLGASPGQRLLGMRIGAEADGAVLTTGQALARWGLLGAPFGISALLTTAFSGLGHALFDLAVIAWYALLLVTTSRSPTKQGLHDRVARTVVAKEASPVRWDRRGIDAR
jgi:uncharacterized RDD family membrane protein YckC